MFEVGEEIAAKLVGFALTFQILQRETDQSSEKSNRGENPRMGSPNACRRRELGGARAPQPGFDQTRRSAKKADGE